MNFGQILNLHVRDGDPIYPPEPTVLVQIKLDGDEGQRPESKLADFALSEGAWRLMAQLDAFGTAAIDSIEVRSGVPRLIVVRSALREARR